MKKPTMLSPLERDQRKLAIREYHEKRDADPEFLKRRAWLQEIFKGDYENLAGFAVRLMMSESALLKENAELCEKLNEIHRTAHYLSDDNPLESNIKAVIADFSMEMHADNKVANDVAKKYKQVFESQLQISKMAKVAADAKANAAKRAKAAADARFDQPGGARDKQAAIKAAWATGKFTSRNYCAEQECAALDMPFSTARKALIGTPDPS